MLMPLLIRSFAQRKNKGNGRFAPEDRNGCHLGVEVAIEASHAILPCNKMYSICNQVSGMDRKDIRRYIH